MSLPTDKLHPSRAVNLSCLQNHDKSDNRPTLSTQSSFVDSISDKSDLETVKESKAMMTSKKNINNSTTQVWGRATTPSTLSSVIMLVTPPIFVMYFLTSCSFYDCKPDGVVRNAVRAFTNGTLGHQLWEWSPRLTQESFTIWTVWLVVQALLYIYVPPTEIGKGQLTPAGHILPYNINGLRCFIISFALYLAGASVGLWRLSLIADNWPGLIVMANIGGYALTIFCYIKAHLFPSHADDRKFSGSWLYDLYMGIEFNPRIGEMFDFKLFFNGRPGIVAWPMITFSFGAAQYARDGFLANSFVLVFLLHLLYTVDFFINESWYVRTIDIAHDHMGFMLAWGDLVFLPSMYTLQGQFLYRQPKVLEPWALLAITTLGLTGYYIFRATNAQKDLVRLTNGDCLIWGKKPNVIRAAFSTSDGKQHTSLLLCDGWWGVCRQINYAGDLMLSLSECLCCGVSGSPWVIGYFYFFWMAALLTHRVYRSDQRCRAKYGATWDEYCRRVPYKMIPYVF